MFADSARMFGLFPRPRPTQPSLDEDKVQVVDGPFTPLSLSFSTTLALLSHSSEEARREVGEIWKETCLLKKVSDGERVYFQNYAETEHTNENVLTLSKVFKFL